MTARRRRGDRGGHAATLLGACLACTAFPSSGCAKPARAAVVTVDPAERWQTIEAFGVFGAQRVWWDPAPHFDRPFVERLVDDLGVSVVRTQIYWDGERENDDGDPNHFEWSRFDFGPTSDNGKQFAYLRELHSRGVRIVASVWTPPPWMKERTEKLASFCTGQCGGNLRATERAEFAEYLAAYVLRLREDAGVPLHSLSIQNEPLFPNPFESCVYDAASYAAALRAVGQRFRNEGLPTGFFGPEHMGDYDGTERSGLFSTLEDASTARYLTAFAVHGYLNGVDPDFGSAQGWTKLSEQSSRYGKPLWMTETSAPHDDAWPEAWNMARSLHLALRFGRVTSYVYWAAAGRLVDAAGEPLPLYHLLKPWYRLVRPGATQVASRSDESRLLVTAFSKGGNLTVIALNNGDAPLTAELAVKGAVTRSWRTFRVTEAEGFKEAGASGPSVTFPRQSITALVADDLIANVPNGSKPAVPRAAPSAAAATCAYHPSRPPLGGTAVLALGALALCALAPRALTARAGRSSGHALDAREAA